MRNRFLPLLLLVPLLLTSACGGGGGDGDGDGDGDGGDSATTDTQTDGGEDTGGGDTTPPAAPTVSCSPLSVGGVSAPNGAFSTAFSKQVTVLGVATIFAEASVSDAKILHAAGVVAQYLDNNADGTIDNGAIESSMRGASPIPTMVMFATAGTATETAFNSSGGYGHPLYGEEVHPEGTSATVFDASLEECLHLINDNGWKRAWPSVFGATAGTTIANLMDAVASAGYYTGNPTPGVDNRDYGTQVDEFHYWNITSILGIQSIRASEIAFEWRLPSASQIQAASPDSYALFTNSGYGMPTVAPNGNYCK